jgi:hypothetical protein
MAIVIVNDYSQADSAALKNVLTSSMGARLNLSTVVITTESDKHTSSPVGGINIVKYVRKQVVHIIDF